MNKVDVISPFFNRRNVEWRKILIKYQIYIILWLHGVFFSPFLIPALYLEPKTISKWCIIIKVEEREPFSMMKAPELCQEAGSHSVHW